MTMSKMIQIRNVPDEIHGTIKSRAARSGMSLSDYLLRELWKITQRPSPEEFMVRLHTRDRVNLDSEIVDIIRRERNGS